jgi:tRNA G18 (ribose-2'-O)-methylase SpoU
VIQSPKIDAISKMAKTLGIKTKYMHRAKLSKFCGNRPHQNVILKCSRIEYENIRSMKELLGLNKANDKEVPPTGKFFIFLDQVTDPQNFGSILRSAMFIGVDGVIVNKANSCGLTPVVSKVSSGALEFIPLYSVKFVSHFFTDAKKAPLNFRVISTNLEDSSSDFVEQAPNEDGDLDETIDYLGP